MDEQSGLERASLAVATKRDRLPWPKDKPFRILSIDGGGIKGIYPAAVLSEIENRLLGGQAVGNYFDLIAGTSTGGILALGLAKGLTAGKLLNLYMTLGKDVFAVAWWHRALRSVRGIAMYMYSLHALKRLTVIALEETQLFESKTRLCIPAFGTNFSEVAVLKTPHHPTCAKLDYKKYMVDVALMTAAAPVYFQAFDHDGYRYVDGGVWANNPTMIAVVEALTVFEIEPEQLRILSLGCGREPYHAGWWRAKVGGLLSWCRVIYAAMHLQSENAINQAKLLAGPPNVLRLAPRLERPIRLDDWKSASRDLPSVAENDVDLELARIAEMFLGEPADPPVFFHEVSSEATPELL